MTTLHHNGRTLRITGELGYERYDDCPYPGWEPYLASVKVQDADTDEDLTDELEHDQAVNRAAWQAAREAEQSRNGGDA